VQGAKAVMGCIVGELFAEKSSERATAYVAVHVYCREKVKCILINNTVKVNNESLRRTKAAAEVMSGYPAANRCDEHGGRINVILCLVHCCWSAAFRWLRIIGAFD
jgi:hypothetical protein